MRIGSAELRFVEATARLQSRDRSAAMLVRCQSALRLRRTPRLSLQATVNATPSKRCVYSSSAASPRARTSATISRTRSLQFGGTASAPADATQRDAPAADSRRPMEKSAVSSCQHLLDWQHEDRAGAGALQAFERFPENVLAAHGVHRNFVAGAVQRHDRR